MNRGACALCIIKTRKCIIKKFTSKKKELLGLILKRFAFREHCFAKIKYKIFFQKSYSIPTHFLVLRELFHSMMGHDNGQWVSRGKEGTHCAIALSQKFEA